MRNSLGNRYIDGTELHRILDEDTSGILNDSPVMNWTEEDVKRFGVKLELKDNHTAPKPCLLYTSPSPRDLH